jgi:tricorn protease
MAEAASFSPDGTRLAYMPFSSGIPKTMPRLLRPWRGYRGGLVSQVRIATLADSAVEPIPRDNSNDSCPMWLGDKVYFLSDRNGPTTLFAYDPATRRVTQVLENHGSDIKSASAGPDVIVYEQFGSLSLFDPATGQSRPVDVRVKAEFPETRTRFAKVAKLIENARLSPTGARVVLEARGEVLTVPAEKGDVRNLTETTGVAERDPAWSPDGQWIAYFSDESGEYQLHLRRQDGTGEVRKFTPGDAPSFYYGPTWSPDAKRIAYIDKRLNLWVLDVDSGKSTKVDTNTYNERTLEPTWSPDSRWVVYTKVLKNYLHAVFALDVATGKRHQLTDGMRDFQLTAFDKGGKYLYVTASTDVGPAQGPDMSRINRPVTRGAYVVVLAEGEASPLAPESDEEQSESMKKESPTAEKEAKKPPLVRIDPDDIDQRTLALPIPARRYVGLFAGKAGTVFLVEGPVFQSFTGPEKCTVYRFDLAKRKAEKILEGVSDVQVSFNGEKLLFHRGDNWFIASKLDESKPAETALKTDAVEVRVDPRAEWRQMFHEVWRIERDFLCDPNYHGYDLKAAERKYEPYLAGVAGRGDLNYLFADMLGDLTLGHVRVQGGDLHRAPGAKGGLLGANFAIDGGRYRFARVYGGENRLDGQGLDAALRAPLTQPGARVRQGDYLLAVNGREVKASDNVYRFFEGTAGKAVLVRVARDADGTGAREVTVVPTADERGLRYRAWVEDNRRKVEQMTGGRVAYVPVPDTFMDGYATFNHYFFAQVDKEAAVFDARFNDGGFMPDYLVENMHRQLLSYASTRDGADQTLPRGVIQGPKVMLINELAGSGGDALPHYFRQLNIGPLVGERTWGGLVGVGSYPTLLDGGRVTAPHFAHWFPSGKWEVENYGVAPDVQVEADPQSWRAGRDPQLEKAVDMILEALKKNPPAKPQRPAYPDYHKRAAAGGKSAARP